MKVLLLNGSPKGTRSNTYRLSKAFLEGLAPDEIRERIVKNLSISPCLGCFSCWNKTPGKCCIDDDMAQILEGMLWADVIIWSFPLYYFSVPGPLKNLMDRQLPMSLPFMNRESESGGHPSRYDGKNQRHVVISTCGFYRAEGNYDGVNALFDHLCGKENYTTIYCGQGELFRVPELHEKTNAYLGDVKLAGQEFSQGGISRETKEKLSRLLFPREVFEAMADASWGIEQSGTPTEESLIFTRQMAALYHPQAWPGKDLVLEMWYTDINKRFQILLTQNGSQVLADGFREATTIIETPYSLWKAIAAGEEKGQDALMQGKYRVHGDFSLMIQWDKFFGSQEEAKEEPSCQKPTNMALLLLPWMAFWISTASVPVRYAALITLLATAIAPLLFQKNRLIASDSLSAAGVTLCAVLLLLDWPMLLVLPLSYLLFGLLWTLGGMKKIPLTAYYSVNDYGNAMIDNPLFLKTNRILTLCWGILYLLMTAWTYCLLTLGHGWVATVNSLLPMAMGIFTVWFQKWYPAHVAKGK